MRQSTKWAKRVYWLSGKVSKIKTYSQTYRMQNEDEWLASEKDMEMMFVKDGRRWSSTKYTWKLLSLAHMMDHRHFDHWALNHDGCGTDVCDTCGGIVCPYETGEDD